MKTTILLLLLATQLIFSQEKQEPTKYKYGRNGIVLISTSDDETVVVSTYKAKATIKDEIGEKVYEMYINKQAKINDTVTIVGKDATVTGKYTIEKKGTLTTVSFIYEKVEWNTGLVEVSE